jgi:hypothetical protein
MQAISFFALKDFWSMQASARRWAASLATAVILSLPSCPKRARKHFSGRLICCKLEIVVHENSAQVALNASPPQQHWHTK